MDFKLANQLADQISSESTEKERCELVRMCLTYLLKKRKNLGFYCISEKEICDELAADAVADAIMIKDERNLPFAVCLQNTFRDLCRERQYILREQYAGDIMTKCDIADPPFMMGTGSKSISAEQKVQNAELLNLANMVIDNHDRFSKKVIYEKMRGSTYPEMAGIFDSTSNECKRVYWHDINDVKKKILPKYNN